MILLDVGAHEGQTLEEAVRYDLDHIFAFEPMPAQYAILLERFHDRPNVTLLNFGLSDSTGPQTLYGSNEQMEASVFAEKEDVDAAVETEAHFLEASEFFGSEFPERGAFVKLNCEGSEAPIIRNLIGTGAIWNVASLLVDFDVQHIPGMEAVEQDIRERLSSIGFDSLVTSEEIVPKGRERRVEGTYRYTRADEIMCWLKSEGVAEL